MPLSHLHIYSHTVESLVMHTEEPPKRERKSKATRERERERRERLRASIDGVGSSSPSLNWRNSQSGQSALCE